MPPFLFSLYLNDLEEFLFNKKKNVIGLSTITDALEIELEIFLKLFIILYADDTVLLAESPFDLQKQIDAFYEYCRLWKLRVNVDKTKVLVFGSRRLPQNLKFDCNGLNIEIVYEFNYLGIVFTKTGNFNVTKKCMINKATRSFYELGRMYKLKIKCQLDLFDKMVKQILLYGCEVWGFGDNDIVKSVILIENFKYFFLI